MTKPSPNYPHTAIVTGAASGIGRATADLLIAEGWKVACLDRDENGLAAIHSASGGDERVLTRVLDVTDEAAVVRVVGEVANAFGGIGGVVNCAGIAADKHVFDTSAELFRRILDVNVVGTFLIGREAARFMREQGGGAIVNVASISGLRGSKGRSAYGASKGGVVTLTQVMANDLAPFGIRVNAVAPGPVETPMVRALLSDADRTLYARYVPMKRFGEPGEIASVIVFLLDDKRSGYVTGEILAVDGGFRGAGIIVDRA